MKTRTFARHTAGFTLAELMIVISLIIILAALTIGGYNYAMKGSKRRTTEATLTGIESALERYFDKYGEFPQPSAPDESYDVRPGKTYNVGGAKCLYQALRGDGFDAIEGGSNGASPEASPQSDGNFQDAEVGQVTFKPGGQLAAADRYVIKIKGKQTHGSQPWAGVDPITVAAQVVMGIQTIVSRQMELTREAAVISIGRISGGVRNNIIPEEVELEGTIRTLDVDMQADLHDRLRRTATNIAEASGASAEVEIIKHVPITFNNPELVAKMGPTMKRVCGEDNVSISRAATASEDFAFFANEIPCFFFSLGGMTKGRDPKTVGPHHTPDFFIDESGLKLGVRVLSNLVLDYSTKIGK